MDELGLTNAEQSEGWILTCARTALSDLNLHIEDLSRFNIPKPQTLPCKISSKKLIAPDVIHVSLRLPATRFDFLSGQYIEIIGPNGLRRSYSIANNNFESKHLEFHIKRVDGGLFSDYWFQEAKVNDLLRLYGPLGTFFLRDVKDKTIVLLATGTGFAPVKAILESLSQVKPKELPRSIRVYWGGRVLTDLYDHAPDIGFPYVFKRVLSRSADGDVQGYVQDACLGDISDFQNTMVFACGSNAMIEDSRRVLVKAGLEESEFYSDAFVCSSSP
jgi:CDP-4-dehydro-6-deoxyglucose reductase